MCVCVWGLQFTTFYKRKFSHHPFILCGFYYFYLKKNNSKTISKQNIHNTTQQQPVRVKPMCGGEIYSHLT